MEETKRIAARMEESRPLWEERSAPMALLKYRAFSLSLLRGAFAGASSVDPGRINGCAMSLAGRLCRTRGKGICAPGLFIWPLGRWLALYQSGCNRLHTGKYRHGHYRPERCAGTSLSAQ